MSTVPLARGRLAALGVVGSLLVALLVKRRRDMARYADEFHQRYG